MGCPAVIIAGKMPKSNQTDNAILPGVDKNRRLYRIPFTVPQTVSMFDNGFPIMDKTVKKGYIHTF